MIQYLTLGQVLFLHQRLINQPGGASGIRDQAALEGERILSETVYI